MFTWPSLDLWCERVREELNDAVVLADDKLGARGVYREIRRQKRPINVAEATFSNGITKGSASHVPMLSPFWHTLDLINNRETIHSIARQLGLLVAPLQDYHSAAPATLFGAFAIRNEEGAQTQKLVKTIMENEKEFSTLTARESVLKEIYEDFCESLSLIFMIEQTYLETGARTRMKTDDPWQTRYAKLESCVYEKLEELAADGLKNGELSNRVIASALRSKRPVQLSLPNFLKLMFLDEKRELAAIFLASLGYEVGPQPKLRLQAVTGDLISTYAELESRQADTVAKIDEALKDKKISRTELDEIYLELIEEHEAQVQLVMAAGILNPTDQNLAQPS